MNGHGGARPGSGRPRKHKSKNSNEKLDFTPQQLTELLNSPHVAYVSRKTITFTQSFKEMFWQRHCDGVGSVQIFIDAGLNPDMVGKTRIEGFVSQLKQQREKGLLFDEEASATSDLPERSFDIPSLPRMAKGAIPISPDQAARLTHQVAYLTQELEFIKKIILADRGVKQK